MSKDIGVKLQQVLDRLGEMDKNIESVIMANVAGLEKTMTNIQSEVSSLKVRADSAETKLREMDTGYNFQMPKLRISKDKAGIINKISYP